MTTTKPRYRLKRANEHCLVFERVNDPSIGTTNYLVSRVTWSRWCRGDWP